MSRTNDQQRSDQPDRDLRGERQLEQISASRSEARRKRSSHSMGKRRPYGRMFAAFGVRIVIIAFVLALPLYLTGFFDRWIDPIIGDDGSGPHRQALARLRGMGFRTVWNPTVVSSATGFTRIELELELDRCYAVVVGAGPRIEAMVIRDARGRQIADKKTGKHTARAAFCAAVAGQHIAHLTLTKPGRLTWSLHRRVEQ